MLKVLINEEEVVSNQNLTIDKQMLNTPSVILKNVCPKTWRDNNDYTTNFYHPQDYSKCKILDVTDIPAEPGSTIEGTTFTIPNNDNNKLHELTTLKGNTTQASTPTPETPIPIEVVTGRQEINVVGKNLFNLNDTFYRRSTNNTVSISGNDITIQNNQSGNTNGFVWWNIPINTSNKITISYGDMVETTANGNNNLSYIFSDTPITAYNSSTIGSATAINKTNKVAKNITPTEQYLVLILKSRYGGADYSYTISDIQVEYSSTASEYEEYKGQSYEINLGKNLFDKDNANILNANFNSYETNKITSNANSRTIYIPCEPSTTYTITKQLGARFFIGYTKTTPALNVEVFGRVGGNNLTKLTITTGNDATYLVAFVYNSAVDTSLTLQQVLDSIQIERGSQATSYSPYKTPIELCKIGDYKDRIYKNNDKWYIEKNIEKLVLNGSEPWAVNSSGTSSWNYRINIPTKVANGIGISTHYQRVYISSTNTTQGFNIAYATATTGQVRIRYGTEDTIENFKAWLSTHNVVVYYGLGEPKITEITDSELISQLESIELLEGLNNVSVSSGDLSGIITIHYNYVNASHTEDLLFCGVVKNSGNISLNPREPHYSTLQILDFKTFLSEGELDSFVIYQKTITEAIQMVIANIQDYGFVLGNIKILTPDDIIGAYSTKDKSAYDVFNYIADITQSRWTTRMIDENHVAIDFYDPTLMDEGTEIDYTQTFFENNKIDNMTYSYGSNNYRNKQVMTSSQVYSNISQTQSVVANGYQTQFNTEQPIGKINSITSNGIPLTFATFQERDMGYVADFYYQPGENYFESDDLRSTGEILIIDYVSIVEGRQVITNPSEINRINESTNRKGIISRYEQRNDATTSMELQRIGETYIKYKGTPEIKLKISTRKNIWEVGERVQFNAPITELDTEYMVRTKKINYIASTETIFYDYELISSFNSETEINYFDNQRAKASGNIGEGEYISRNIDIESTANIIFYNTASTEVQVDGDNVLNSILNSPFIS